MTVVRASVAERRASTSCRIFDAPIPPTLILFSSIFFVWCSFPLATCVEFGTGKLASAEGIEDVESGVIIILLLLLSSFNISFLFFFFSSIGRSQLGVEPQLLLTVLVAAATAALDAAIEKCVLMAVELLLVLLLVTLLTSAAAATFSPFLSVFAASIVEDSNGVPLARDVVEIVVVVVVVVAVWLTSEVLVVSAIFIVSPGFGLAFNKARRSSSPLLVPVLLVLFF
mmetsp:Transcript_27992/g.45069  ORF Transcript_27992/g.45069 Transcript_27992/m.45069 type:complete len:227 (-) Transcript_27992:1199-1879(-)